MKKMVFISLFAFMSTSAFAFTEQYICQASDTLVTFKLKFEGNYKTLDAVVFNGDILPRKSYFLTEMGYDPAAKGERYTITLKPGYGAIKEMVLIRRDVTSHSSLILNGRASSGYSLRCKKWTRN